MLHRTALWIACIAASAAAAEEPIVISAGPDRGSYHFIGERLKTELILRNERLPVLLTSQGSEQNLQRLDDEAEPVNVALTQADALRAYLLTHPGFAEEFFVMGDMGRECALLISRNAGGLEGVADLKREGTRSLAVGPRGSGASVTYAALTALDAAYAGTKTVHTSPGEALVQLRSGGGFTDLVAVLLVQRPTRESPPLRAVLGDLDAYRFVPIAEDDVPNAKLPDGSSIYSFGEIHVGRESRDDRPRLRTFCTRALLLGSTKKLTDEQRQTLADLLLEAEAKIAGMEP